MNSVWSLLHVESKGVQFTETEQNGSYRGLREGETGDVGQEYKVSVMQDGDLMYNNVTVLLDIVLHIFRGEILGVITIKINNIKLGCLEKIVYEQPQQGKGQATGT